MITSFQFFINWYATIKSFRTENGPVVIHVVNFEVKQHHFSFEYVETFVLAPIRTTKESCGVFLVFAFLSLELKMR